METKGTMVASALIGSALWGLSGTVSSILFDRYDMPYQSLVMIRMLVSGLMLMVFSRGLIEKKDIPLFLIFAIPGLFGVQYLYMATISYSNAPVATLLQFIFFPIVALYDFIRNRKISPQVLLISIILSAAGIYELTTGYPYTDTSLIVPFIALLLGLATAFAAALYTIASSPLVRRYGGLRTVSLGMITGGLVSMPFGYGDSLSFFSGLPSSQMMPVLIYTVFVVVFGTATAFYLYIRSMRHISPVEAAVAGTLEPLAAAISSFMLLGIRMNFMQYIGGVLIIMAIIVVVLGKSKGAEG